MDRERRKQLLEDYKNRKPEMGVISIYCKATGETFLGSSNDTKAGISSNRAKLSFGGHPNQKIQRLWAEHGEESFLFSVHRVLEYDDPTQDQTAKLEQLLAQCLEADQSAAKIWR